MHTNASAADRVTPKDLHEVLLAPLNGGEGGIIGRNALLKTRNAAGIEGCNWRAARGDVRATAGTGVGLGDLLARGTARVGGVRVQPHAVLGQEEVVHAGDDGEREGCPEERGAGDPDSAQVYHLKQ